MATSTQRVLAGVSLNPGERRLHRFSVGTTSGGFAVEAQLHLIAGSQPGPTLAIQAGLSGLEIEPALTLPSWIAAIDPKQLQGNLIVAPLFNLSGFEFEQIDSIWDGTDFHQSGLGSSDGTLSEQLLNAYASMILQDADTLIDIRTGSQWGYYHYAGVHDVGNQDRITTSLDLATVLGLPHVALGEPVNNTFAGKIAEQGKPVVTVWIGGGPGLRDHRERDAKALTNLLDATLHHLGMLAGQAQSDSPIVRIHTILRPTGARGLTFMNTALRGQQVAAGDELGIVRHSFEGTVLSRICAPHSGIVLHAGASWPVVPEGTPLAILGDPL